VKTEWLSLLFPNKYRHHGTIYTSKKTTNRGFKEIKPKQWFLKGNAQFEQNCDRRLNCPKCAITSDISGGN
jgi:hypothetical protein